MAKTEILTKDGLTIYDGKMKSYIKDLTDDTVYIDPDEESTEIEEIEPTTKAEYVSYDNTSTQLEATTVQGAIDEINTSVNTINTSAVKTYNFSLSGNKIYKLYSTDTDEPRFNAIVCIAPAGPSDGDLEIVCPIYKFYPYLMAKEKTYSSIKLSNNEILITAISASSTVMVLSDCDTLVCEYYNDYTSE